MSTSKTLRLVSGILEAILAIPILGGTIVVGFLYLPLTVMFVLHIVTLVLSKRDREPIAGSIVGIVTSVVGWIPVLGWAMHLISAIILLVSMRAKN